MATAVGFSNKPLVKSWDFVTVFHHNEGHAFDALHCIVVDDMSFSLVGSTKGMASIGPAFRPICGLIFLSCLLSTDYGYLFGSAPRIHLLVNLFNHLDVTPNPRIQLFNRYFQVRWTSTIIKIFDLILLHELLIDCCWSMHFFLSLLLLRSASPPCILNSSLVLIGLNVFFLLPR